MKTATHDWELHQGAAVDELIPVTGLPTTGVGVRCHIRDTLDALAPRLILSHDGQSNRRITVSAEGLRIQIGATVSGSLSMLASRNRWVYDAEVYSLTDADNVLKPVAGTVYAYKEATRESDTQALPPLASGDGRYLRIDGDQGLTPEQQAWAQHNSGTTPGGPGGASDHGALTGLADDDHPQYHNNARGDARYDALGAASAAVGAHAGATDPHGDRAYTDTQIAGRQAASATLTTLSSATAAGLALMDDATAADQRTTLGLGTAATAATGDFAAASHTHAASDVTSGTFDPARLPAATDTAQGAVELATTAEALTGTDTTRAVTAAGVKAVADTKAASSHTHAASDITSGTIATARLGSGTANSTTFLRGDQTWATLSGGSANTKWIGAGELIPRVTNGAGIDGEELATNDINLDYLAFDSATSEGAQVSFAWPSGFTTLTATFHWTAASGTGGVRWQASARCYADDDAMDQAQGTSQAVSDTLLAANDAHKSGATSAITPGGTVSAGNLCVVEIERDPSHGDDTLAVDARLIGVMLEFA